MSCWGQVFFVVPLWCVVTVFLVLLWIVRLHFSLLMFQSMWTCVSTVSQLLVDVSSKLTPVDAPVHVDLRVHYLSAC